MLGAQREEEQCQEQLGGAKSWDSGLPATHEGPLEESALKMTL